MNFRPRKPMHAGLSLVADRLLSMASDVGAATESPLTSRKEIHTDQREVRCWILRFLHEFQDAPSAVDRRGQLRLQVTASQANDYGCAFRD